jgi:hypothetical protein
MASIIKCTSFCVYIYLPHGMMSPTTPHCSRGLSAGERRVCTGRKRKYRWAAGLKPLSLYVPARAGSQPECNRGSDCVSTWQRELEMLQFMSCLCVADVSLTDYLFIHVNSLVQHFSTMCLVWHTYITLSATRMKLHLKPKYYKDFMAIS